MKSLILKGNFVLRYLQIFAWGRVMEINEDVAMRAVSVTLLSMSMWIMYCMNLNLQMVIFFRAFSKLDSEDMYNIFKFI